MILPTIAKMLVQEHRYRPITGRVLCLGPQFVPMHKGQVDALFASTPAEADRARAEWRAQGSPQEPVSDEYFFRKFPIDKLDSLDVVPGYGGTIIHDLNVPVGSELHNQFDFIVDGGTFDHLMQLGTAFRNVIRMLKPGGRVLHYNAASGYIGAAYVSFGPDLFYDYYVVNKFADCKVWVARGTGPHTSDPFEMFYLPTARTKALNSAKHQMVVCLAEKRKDSTWEGFPVEYTYRPPDLREEFAASQKRVQKSKRPPLVGERRLWSSIREWVKRTRIEATYAFSRYREGKLRWDKFRRTRWRATGYIYVGQL